MASRSRPSSWMSYTVAAVVTVAGLIIGGIVWAKSRA